MDRLIGSQRPGIHLKRQIGSSGRSYRNDDSGAVPEMRSRWPTTFGSGTEVVFSKRRGSGMIGFALFRRHRLQPRHPPPRPSATQLETFGRFTKTPGRLVHSESSLDGCGVIEGRLRQLWLDMRVPREVLRLRYDLHSLHPTTEGTGEIIARSSGPSLFGWKDVLPNPGQQKCQRKAREPAETARTARQRRAVPAL